MQTPQRVPWSSQNTKPHHKNGWGLKLTHILGDANMMIILVITNLNGGHCNESR
jgi:hypothetical protein